METGRICSTPGKDGFQRIAVEFLCKDSEPCWPDPDDFSVWDSQNKMATNWGVSDVVIIDDKDNLVQSVKQGSKFRTVWDLSMKKGYVPSVFRLAWDYYPLTKDIIPKGSCSVFSKAVRVRLDIQVPHQK